MLSRVHRTLGRIYWRTRFDPVCAGRSENRFKTVANPPFSHLHNAIAAHGRRLQSVMKKIGLNARAWFGGLCGAGDWMGPCRHSGACGRGSRRSPLPPTHRYPGGEEGGAERVDQLQPLSRNHEKLPDVNVAEALQRIPGISMETLTLARGAS